MGSTRALLGGALGSAATHGLVLAAVALACESTPLTSPAEPTGAAGDGGVSGSSSGSAGSGHSGAGSGGSSGSTDGGAGSGGSGGEAGAPDCDDGDPSTSDFHEPLYGCAHLRDSDPNDGASWIVYDAGFSVDPKTGYGWVDLSAGSGGSPLDAARAQCAAFSLAGLGDWTLPTIDDARTLASGCAPTLTGGSCPLRDPSCLDQQCGYGAAAECESCKAGDGPAANGAYCNPDATICSFFHTSSLCTDCPGSNDQDWQYGPSNGNFAPGPSSDSIAVVCVQRTVPGSLP